MRIIWSEIAQATFVRFMADQAGMMAVNRAVEALADDPAPLGAFVRGAYRRLGVGPCRVLYEVEANLITIVRIGPRISCRPPNPSQITGSTRCHPPPWKRSAKSP